MLDMDLSKMENRTALLASMGQHNIFNIRGGLGNVTVPAH